MNQQPLTLLSLLLLLSLITACTGNDILGSADGDEASITNTLVDDEDELSSNLLNLEPGTVIGRLQLDAPNSAEFILHGTLPLPFGLYPRPDGQEAFGIVDSDGEVIPAQTEITSRFALPEWAEVVELIARVKRPATATAGERIQYDVIIHYHEPNTAPPAGMSASNLLKQVNSLPTNVVDFLSQSKPLEMHAEDFYGNRYHCDLLDGADQADLLKFGENQVTVRTYCTMRPLAGNPGAGKSYANGGEMPHLFGVHAYLSSFAGEEVMRLDLRINNGPTNLDTAAGIKPLGNVYLRYLDVEPLVSGWAVGQHVQDPFFRNGRLVDQIRNHDDYDYWDGSTLIKLQHKAGDMHLFPHRAQFHRRLGIYPVGQSATAQRIVARAGLAFATDGVNEAGTKLFSWWHKASARFLAQSHVIASLENIGGEAAINEILNKDGGFNDYINNLEKGHMSAFDTLPFEFPVLGAFHPAGAHYGGVSGSGWIEYFTGSDVLAAAINAGYRLLMLEHRAHNDRQQQAYFNEDGTPIKRSHWTLPATKTPQYLPFKFEMDAGADAPFGDSEAPNPHEAAITAAGFKPTYANYLLPFAPWDLQHFIRWSRSAKALVWIGNDSLAKDDLWRAANIIYMSVREISSHPTLLQSESPAAKTIVNLAKEVYELSPFDPLPEDLSTLQGNRIGFSTGRDDGWAIDTMASYYALAPDSWRDEVYPWFEKMVDIFSDGQSTCSGMWKRQLTSKIVDGEYEGTQIFEEQILQNALRGVGETVYRGRDAELTDQVRAIIIGNALAMMQPYLWNASENGPANQQGLNDIGSNKPFWAFQQSLFGPPPPYCSQPPTGPGGTVDWPQLGGVFADYSWPTFAWGYAITGDKFFFQRAGEMVGAPGDLASLPLHELAATVLARFKQDGYTETHMRAAIIGSLEQP